MQILNIPELKGNFYGGKPYSLNLQIGFGDTPSELTVQCVNQNGIYQKPKPSWTNKVTIKIGEFNFQGFLVEWRINKSVSEKTLELVYEDTSSLLRKTWVGLHKRHGINPNATASYQNSTELNIGYQDIPTTSHPNLIIMGREMHPCDINNDGNISNLDAIDQIDFCDPCPNCPTDKYKYRCSSLNDLKIFEVKYRFSDLLKTLNIPVPSKIAARTNYYRDYQGKLQDVLSNWCNDFGFTYYWDYKASTLSEGIKLVDRTIPLSIDFTPNDCDITELYDGESIKNCFAQGTISYYAREGDSRSYNCSNSTYNTLNCLHLRDLFNKQNYSDFDNGIKWRELAVGLSYYSPALRDCMYWFNYYGINNASKAKEKIIQENETPNKILDIQNQSKILRELGGMKILKVITKEDDGFNFNRCSALMGDSIAPYIERSKQLNRSDDQPSYYFFIAEYNEEIAANQFAKDSDLAENYMGRFWVKAGTFDTCNGVAGNSRQSNVNIQGYDGENGDYIKQGNQGTYPNFCNYGHEASSPIDDFISDSKEQQDEFTRQVNLGGYTAPIKISKSLILLEREPKWYPNKSEISIFQQTIDYYQNLIFQKVDITSNGKPNILSELNPKYSQNNNIYLFVVQEVDQPLSIKVSEVDNFLEPNGLQKIYANTNDAAPCTTNPVLTDNDNQVLIGTVGLKNTKCAWIDFDGFSFMMPSQAAEIQGLDYGDSGPFDYNDNVGGYKVKIDTDFDIPVCIPKIQTVMINIPNSNENFGELDINYIDISNEDINIFAPGTCSPNSQQLELIHKEKGIQTSISNTRAERTLQYKTIGLPSNIPEITDGLDNLTVRVSDNGVFTIYSLSDKLRKRLSPDLYLSDSIRKRYSSVGSYPTTNPYNIINN